MARDLSRVKVKFINAVKGIYSTASYGATASIMTVDELQNLVQNLFADYNNGEAAWSDLVTLQGATQARNLLAEIIDSPSADISAQLAIVSTDLRAVLDAYETAFSAGTANRTFAYTVVSGQLDGGFADINVSAGVLNSVNTLCATLQASVTDITPVN